MTAQEMWKRVGPSIVKECLARQPGNTSFTTREIFDAVPEISRVYRTPKTLGDRLGQGVAGHGLGLHPSPGGDHLRCRENATLAVWGACCDDFLSIRRRLADGEEIDDAMPGVELDKLAVEDLADTVGFDDAETLSAGISSLPSYRDLT
jgi:hypothetical protein